MPDSANPANTPAKTGFLSTNVNTLIMAVVLGAVTYVGNGVSDLKTGFARIEEAQKHAAAIQSQYDLLLADLRTRLTKLEMDFTRLRADLDHQQKTK